MIDLASAPTPWHRRWDGGMEGREGERGEVHNAAAPATLRKPCQPQTTLLLSIFLSISVFFYLTTSLIPFFQFFPPPPWP